MDILKTLEQLSLAPGPSGAEEGVRDIAAKLLKPYMDEIHVDVLGNLIGRKFSSNPGAKRVLIEAHMDEIGFVVTGSKDGFLTLETLGGLDPRHLPGAKLTLLSNPPRFGVIPCLPPHVLSEADQKKPFTREGITLDLGLSQEEAKAIPLGTPLVYDTTPGPMGDGFFQGKALDNRAGMAAVLLALSRFGAAFHQVDVTVLFSVQEELTGLEGVRPALFALEPDYCIVLDVTAAHTPDTAETTNISLGKGPVIAIGPVLNRHLSARLKELALEGGIPHQVEVLPHRTDTSADLGQISRHGVPTALISLPLKYIHSPRELLCLSDMEEAALLLSALIQNLGGGETHA